MTTIINASTSGLAQTADLSASLQIQTANTAAVTIGTDQNITCNSTGAITISSGTTAQRPSGSNVTNGMIRYNSNTTAIEGYISGAWANLSVTPQTITASYLSVAGGGGGGNGNSGFNVAGGGGGAGGYLANTAVLTSGTVYTITVGAGGAGAINQASGPGVVGSNSSITGSGFTTVTCLGGGYGGAAAGNGGNGGSGGGGGGYYGPRYGGTGVSGQGYAGGTGSYNNPFSGAGGGGAGAAGSDNNAYNEGAAGGVGLASSITGTSTYYAGGGGGGSYVSGTGAGGNGGGGNGNTGAGSNGGTNLGGGGGGVGLNTGAGGAGGSGVVILSVLTTQYSNTTTGSPTVTTSGSNTIIKYTASGTYTA